MCPPTNACLSNAEYSPAEKEFAYQRILIISDGLLTFQDMKEGKLVGVALRLMSEDLCHVRPGNTEQVGPLGIDVETGEGFDSIHQITCEGKPRQRWQLRPVTILQ